MNDRLKTKHHICIRGFVDPKRCKHLSEGFRQHTEIVGAKGDEQVPESVALLNHVPFVELLCEKTKEVAEIVEEGVIPSYTYSRIYRRGNELKPHIDRRESEIAISVNLDCDQLWPLWIETPTGEKVKVVLEPGDALLYLGREATHWREPFEGSYCNNVFMFYVLAEGPHRDQYFDRERLRQEAYKSFLAEGETKSSGLSYLSKYVRKYRSLLDEYWCGELAKLESLAESEYADNHVMGLIGLLLKRYAFDTATSNLLNDTGYYTLTIPPGGNLDVLSLEHKSTDRLDAVVLIALTDGVHSSVAGGKLSRGDAVIHPWNFLFPSSLEARSEESQKLIVTWVY